MSISTSQRCFRLSRGKSRPRGCMQLKEGQLNKYVELLLKEDIITAWKTQSNASVIT